MSRRRSPIPLAIAAVAAIALMLGAVAWGLFEGRDHLRQAALSECARVNLLREQANTLARVVYDSSRASALHARQLAELTGNPRMRRVRLDAARASERAARTITHTALTNCKAAVDAPESYAAPTPVRFGP